MSETATRVTGTLTPLLDAKRTQLLAWLQPWGKCVVAFSGGVDSAVVAQAAYLVLGDRVLAVTAHSPSLAQDELEQAVALARQIGIPHRVIATDEFANPNYVRNSADRCYHCKTELYSQLERLAPEWGAEAILAGANADDAGDYRPGMKAAAEHHVRNPLLECGLTKAEVRELAAAWGLPVWDKPATPCLSSRVAYGESVTPARLRQIDEAERFLRQRGLKVARVRYHSGDLARVEVPVEELPRFMDHEFRESFCAYLKQLGFRFVTLDLEGFRSGSLNRVLPDGSLPILS